MNLTAEQIKQALEFCANCECNDEKTEKECALINMSFCKNYLRKQSLDYINRLEADNSRLQAERDKAIKDFTEFAQTAFENPFACKYCKHSVREGRACLWKAEHEEICMGRYFEYKESGG